MASEKFTMKKKVKMVDPTKVNNKKVLIEKSRKDLGNGWFEIEYTEPLTDAEFEAQQGGPK